MISAIITFGLTLAQIYYQETLEESSAYIILYFQSFSNHNIDIIFEILGEATAGIFLIVSGVIFLSGHREIGILALYAGFFGAALSGMLKMLMLHPRPFWKYEAIKIISCPSDWGCPSGHGASAGASMIILGYFWLKEKKYTLSKLFLFFSCAFLTVLNRVYLGVHFYFQVILGYSYGISIGLFMMQQWQIDFFLKIGNDKKNVVIEHIKIIIFTVVSSLIYSFQTAQFHDDFIRNYSSKCAKELTIEKVMIKNISESLLMWIIAGNILGYYLNKDALKMRINLQSIIITTCCFLIIIGYILISDKIILAIFPYYLRFIIFCLNRYIGGYFMSYYMPSIIKKLIDYLEQEIKNNKKKII